MPRDSNREAIIVALVAALKEERLRQELSMNEVATRAGLSHTMTLRVESRQRTPTIDTLLRIAEALDLSLGRLIVRVESRLNRK